MLPQERANIASTEHQTTISIGNRTATLNDHFSFWGRAMWTANNEAEHSGQRHYVLWCEEHQKWAVWNLGSPVIR